MIQENSLEKNINTQIYDKSVDRSAMVRLYEQRIVNKVQEIIDSHLVRLDSVLRSGRLTPAGSRKLLKDVETEVIKTHKENYNVSKRSLMDLVGDQISYTFQTIEAAMSPIWRTQRPMQRLSEDIVLIKPLYKDQTLLEGWSNVGVAERKRLEGVIRKGIAESKTVDQIALEVRSGNIHNITRQQAKALVVTGVTSVAAQADHAVYKANEKAIVGWQYVSVLDSRTTPICKYKDGKIYGIDETQYLPPSHFHCRSSTIPVFKHWDDISKLEGVAQVRKRNISKLSKEQLARYDGQTPSKETYDQWLRRQPTEVQLRHLGDSRKVQLYQDNMLSVDKFFNLNGKSVGINELQMITEATPINDTRRFAMAKQKLDAIHLGVSRPEDLIDSAELTRNLREYYLLQAGELDGTLSLTNYRGTLIGSKTAMKNRVLNNLPREDQMLFNPITNRYEDSRLYQPAPSVLENNLKLIRSSDVLKDEDKKFIESFVYSLENKMGVNQRAVVSDNLRIMFTRYRNNPEVWKNFKAVSQSQMKFDVMNVSDTIETQLRSDSDILKKLKQTNYIDPVLGPTQLDDLHDNFTKNIIERNLWEDRVEPNIARNLRHHFDEHIPLLLRSRMKERDLQLFYLKFARRLAIMETPDFDQTAMELGRDLYTLANLNGSRNKWYETGKNLLESDRVGRFYKLETFGVTKRRMKSRMSGQLFGQYYDTMSYNIRVTDERILKYTKLQRKVELGLRVSVKKDENRLFFKPGRKTYFMKRGVFGDYDTRIPVTSTSSFSEFPDEFIDDNLVEALNWAGKTKYKIDPEFYDFINNLLYFKDDKGKAEYFDNLNMYRKHMINRGDSYERLKAMEWLRKTNESFSNTPFLDHRGRVYDRGLIGPQSGETSMAS